MAFFLQYRAIQRHVKEELQRVTEVPDPLSARFSDEAHELGDLESPGKLNKGEPYTRIPGITLREDGNSQLYYQVDWSGPDDIQPQALLDPTPYLCDTTRMSRRFRCNPCIFYRLCCDH